MTLLSGVLPGYSCLLHSLSRLFLFLAPPGASVAIKMEGETSPLANLVQTEKAEGLGPTSAGTVAYFYARAAEKRKEIRSRPFASLACPIFLPKCDRTHASGNQGTKDNDTSPRLVTTLADKCLFQLLRAAHTNAVAFGLDRTRAGLKLSISSQDVLKVTVNRGSVVSFSTYKTHATASSLK